MSDASQAPLVPEPPQREPSWAEPAISWVKRNPIYTLGVALVPVVGIVTGVPRAWDSISAVLNIPTCLTYSDVYYYYNGHFKKIGQKWIEFQPDVKFSFDEIYRNRDYIVILNKTPRDNPRWEACWSGYRLAEEPHNGHTKIQRTGRIFIKSKGKLLLKLFWSKQNLNNRTRRIGKFLKGGFHLNQSK